MLFSQILEYLHFRKNESTVWKPWYSYISSHISNKLIPLASYFILNLASSLGTMFIMCPVVNLTKEDSMGPERECREEPGAPEVPVDREDGLHLP